jgi:hypothetical protein
MVDLSTDLDDMKTETPAERARKAVAKYRDQCLADVYHALLGIIETESAKGAVCLSLYYYDAENEPLVFCKSEREHYINGTVSVAVNAASMVDKPKLANYLKRDGFKVVTMGIDNFGTVIDSISWE